jgi:hypothetical protein
VKPVPVPLLVLVSVQVLALAPAELLQQEVAAAEPFHDRQSHERYCPVDD